jgi:FkbM family methyltransferase
MSALKTKPALTDRILAGYARRRWRGFLTLQRLLRRPTIEIRTGRGVLFTLHPEDYIDRIVLHDGFYEPEVFDALASCFTPGAILWDIGANFGLHSISAAVADPSLQVHSFEPNPAVFARLEAHARRNETSVRCWPLALGAEDGVATLHINGCGNPGMTTLTPWAEARYDAQVEVRLARADTLIATGEIPPPNLIKLDVEGGEAAVLAGFGERLRDPGLRAVVFETRADLLDDPGQCPAARQLQAAGFDFRALPRAAGSVHALNNFLAFRDHR